MVYKGNTATTNLSDVFDSAVEITSYSLVNKSGGANNVSAASFYGSTVVEFCRKPLASDESYQYDGEPIVIEAGQRIFVNVSASTDFYFTIKQTI